MKLLIVGLKRLNNRGVYLPYYQKLKTEIFKMKVLLTVVNTDTLLDKNLIAIEGAMPIECINPLINEALKDEFLTIQEQTKLIESAINHKRNVSIIEKPNYKKEYILKIVL